MELDPRKLQSILRILAEVDRPLGSTTIAGELQMAGVDLRERMVRYYLGRMDALGLTENLGRAGRRITPKGVGQLRTVVAVEKVGFISARVDELSYRMSFDPSKREGTVVLNVSRLLASDLPRAAMLVNRALDAGLGMGRLVALGREGEELAGHRVDTGEAAVGTVCSVTLNGVFRAAGIPVSSRFGGLLELRDWKPSHFTHVIHYDGTTIDPVEIFLKGKMTRVRQAAETGTGTIGVSFREIPASALPSAQRLLGAMAERGLLGSFHILGRPGQRLLDIPVSQGRAGLVVPAGLNAIAAVEEGGVETRNVAMASLWDYGRLVPAAELLPPGASGRSGRGRSPWGRWG